MPWFPYWAAIAHLAIVVPIFLVWLHLEVPARRWNQELAEYQAEQRRLRIEKNPDFRKIFLLQRGMSSVGIDPEQPEAVRPPVTPTVMVRR